MRADDNLRALHESNRRAADAQIERRLLSLRAQQFQRVAPEQRILPKLPPDGTRYGVPEVDAKDLDVHKLRDAMDNYGLLHVRGLLDAKRTAEMRAAIDAAMEAQEAFFAGAKPETTLPWFEASDLVAGGEGSRAFVARGGAVLAADSPRGIFRLVDNFYALGLDQLITDYFGERPALSAEKSTLRRVPHDANSGGWHQDGRFLGAQIRSLNTWMALTDCGVDAPGMELVPTRLHRIVATGTDDAPFDWTVAPAQVEREFAGQVVRPVFKAGDALFFDHFLLHRTWARPGMTQTRYATETWFFAPSAYPEPEPAYRQTGLLL